MFTDQLREDLAEKPIRRDEPPVFVPAAEVKEKEDRLERELTDAQTAANLDKKAALDAQEKYQSTYPSKLHFDYSWDQNKARALGVPIERER